MVVAACRCDRSHGCLPASRAIVQAARGGRWGSGRAHHGNPMHRAIQSAESCSGHGGFHVKHRHDTGGQCARSRTRVASPSARARTHIRRRTPVRGRALRIPLAHRCASGSPRSALSHEPLWHVRRPPGLACELPCYCIAASVAPVACVFRGDAANWLLCGRPRVTQLVTACGGVEDSRCTRSRLCSAEGVSRETLLLLSVPAASAPTACQVSTSRWPWAGFTPTRSDFGAMENRLEHMNVRLSILGHQASAQGPRPMRLDPAIACHSGVPSHLCGLPESLWATVYPNRPVLAGSTTTSKRAGPRVEPRPPHTKTRTVSVLAREAI